MAYPEFKAIPRRKLVDEVLDQMQRLIQSGQYKSGDKLPPEPELMKLLAVGRSTIREAVKVLTHAGLLEVRQGDGTYIRSASSDLTGVSQAITPKNNTQVMEARRILEIELAGLAALRRTTSDLALMRSALDLRQEALEKGHYAEYVEADISFHIAVAEAGKNEVLLEMYKVVAESLKEMLSQLLLDTRQYEDNTAYHEAMYRSIVNKSSEEAKQFAAQNIDVVNIG
ncbi:transcriptional regulator [Paenibacillus antibioticophila]|uniref:Transcriptional regulator n=2 Tax=Paenibacillus TaxID=44249 RepID=A0A919Y332_9BACL|nr:MULTISPECIES: FadR/GntR family transcriptional regulator [Paenibacillus]GIO38346.1 transcriptional regulator [Paenibacillus antibioticophila]GIO41418.1 transcriptional regulator [Paenibacillus apis]